MLVEKKTKKIIIIVACIVLVVFSLSVFIYLSKDKEEPIILEKKVDTYIMRGRSFVPTLDGNGYVIVGTNNHNNKKIEKASISFFDSKQKVLEKVYNKGYNSEFNDLIYDGDGYVCVGGSAFTKEEYKENTETAIIVKYDMNGQIVFENDFQVKSNSKYYGIVKVEDGYVVCGESTNTSSEEGTSGAVLIRYDKNGQEIWRRYEGSKNATYNDLIYKDGFIYVIGVDNEIGLLSKFDLDGNLINMKYYQGLDSLGFSSITSLNDTIYISGGKKISDNTYGLIVAYNLDGNYINEVTYQGISNNRFNKLVFDKDNNIVVIGNINNSEEEFAKEGLIGKYTDSLKEMSVVKVINNRDVELNDIMVLDSKYAVVGNVYFSKDNISTNVFTFSNSLRNISS